MQLPEIFAANVKRLMAAHSPPLMQVQLAELLGIHQSHVSTLVRGHIWPSAERIEKVAEVFGVTPAELLTAPDAPDAQDAAASSTKSATKLPKTPDGETIYPVKEPSDATQIQRVPDFGFVAAGVAIDPMAEPNEYVDTVGLPRGGEYISFRVRGRSMIDAHIDEGDRIYVRVQPGVENGETVVASIEGKYCLKVHRVGRGGAVNLASLDGITAPVMLGDYDPDDVRIIGVLVRVERVPKTVRKRK